MTLRPSKSRAWAARPSAKMHPRLRPRAANPRDNQLVHHLRRTVAPAVHRHPAQPAGEPPGDRALRPRRLALQIPASHLQGQRRRRTAAPQGAGHRGRIRAGHLPGRLDRHPHGPARPRRDPRHRRGGRLHGLREHGARLLGRLGLMHLGYRRASGPRGSRVKGRRRLCAGSSGRRTRRERLRC